ncbi:tetratricopeptide repeat protein [Flavisolibacter sp. BT320]|nr:tetratricopeptide repeat protein [Flavisolibacter longurius]
MTTELLLERAQVLLQQNRYRDAETFILQALEKDPDNDYTLSLLGRCYINNKRFDEGIAVIERAIAVDPNEGFYFYLLGFAYYQKSSTTAAKTNLEIAIRLSPYTAEYFGLLAHVLLEENSFEAALDKANEGLALEADNITCLNARSIALNKLKRTEDAFETMQSALSQDPDNETTHNVVGWNLLERGRHQEAASHFMESLRINPDYGNAKMGLKEALKSRILLYKWLLQYSFWVNNKGKNLQVALPIILYITFRVLISLSKSGSGSNSLTWILVGLYIFIVVTSWTIGSIANFVLLYHPLGKHALTVSERWSAITAVSALVTGMVIMLLSSLTSIAEGTAYVENLFFAGMVCLSLALPLGQIDYPIHFRNKSWQDYYALGLIGLGLLGLLCFTVAPAAASVLFGVYGLGFLIYNWAGLRG